MADSGEWKEGLLMMMAALSVNDMRIVPSADEAASLVIGWQEQNAGGHLHVVYFPSLLIVSLAPSSLLKRQQQQVPPQRAFPNPQTLPPHHNHRRRHSHLLIHPSRSLLNKPEDPTLTSSVSSCLATYIHTSTPAPRLPPRHPTNAVIVRTVCLNAADACSNTCVVDMLEDSGSVL